MPKLKAFLSPSSSRSGQTDEAFHCQKMSTIRTDCTVLVFGIVHVLFAKQCKCVSTEKEQGQHHTFTGLQSSNTQIVSLVYRYEVTSLWLIIETKHLHLFIHLSKGKTAELNLKDLCCINYWRYLYIVLENLNYDQIGLNQGQYVHHTLFAQIKSHFVLHSFVLCNVTNTLRQNIFKERRNIFCL